MKKLVLAGLACATFAGAPLSASADTFNTQRCMNMGNALDAPREGLWGHTIDADSFRVIAEAGFDTVRIPVRWSAHTSDGPDYVIDAPFFDRVTDVIDQALSHDLQVILNVHHFNDLNEDPDGNRAKFLAIWQQIATRYQDLPNSVYFEIVNEPNKAFKGDLMREIVTEAFEQIRETNPTRILIMGGDNWSGLKSLPSIPVIDDPNQVHTFHYYDPFEFTHQKASWTELKDSPTTHWGSQADRAELSAAAKTARQAQEDLGFPVFLGEIGANEKAPHDDIVRYTRETTEAFEDAGIAWCVWNFTATFPFYDSEAAQWDEPKLAALGLAANGASVDVTPSAITTVQPDEISLDFAINELRNELGGDAEIVMPPEADRLTTYGIVEGLFVDDSGVPGGRAIEITVPKAGQNPWDGGVSGPLTSEIKKGDTLVMTFWAKSVGGRAEISNVGLQMNTAPYSAIDNLMPVSLSPTWTPHAVFVTADRDYKPMDAGYTFHLANAAQTLRLGPVVVFNLGGR